MKRPKTRVEPCELYVEALGVECGLAGVGALEVQRGGGSWLPFWYCSQHRDALADDLRANGFRVRSDSQTA